MLDMSPDTLRDRLRRGSSAAHERLDTEVSRLDLTGREGFAAFLAMQATALDAMIRGGASGDLLTVEMLADLRDSALSDLEVLGVQAPALGDTGPMRREAVDYVILGSRLGTAVLRRRWLEADDELVQRASRYFIQPQLSSLWRSHCAAMSARPGADATADLVLADVIALFTLFRAALDAARKGTD